MTKLARLRRLGVHGIADRLRQEVARRVDRQAWARRPEAPAPSVTDEGLDPADLLAALRAHRPERFHPGASDPRALEQLAADDAYVASLAHDAEQLARGRFDLLGHRDLDFGAPLDWALDPVSGRRAPQVHWTEIDPLDASRLGDAKVPWELARHQWTARLAMLARLRNDEALAERALVAIDDWIDANPPGLGLHWTSSLEHAFRTISWAWVLVLLADTRPLDAERFGRILASIRAQAGHVARYLSTTFSPNTHLTGEALGLFVVGTVFPELREAPRWRRDGERILVAEIERQVHPDGVYFEQSTWYQRYTIEIYVQYAALTRTTGRTVPRRVTETLERLVDVLVDLRHPDGTMPRIGDEDGGWWCSVAPRHGAPTGDHGAFDAFEATFSDAFALLGRPADRWAAGGRAAPQTIATFGAGAWPDVAPSPPPRPPSRRLREGGIAILRSDWSSEATHAVLDVGPLGCPNSSGHGHADLLSVVLALEGEPLLVDPGMADYATDSPWRDAFRRTAAHNTLSIDGRSQAEPAGPFRWTSRPVARWVGGDGMQGSAGDTVEVVAGEHDAFTTEDRRLRHRRAVLLPDHGPCILIDDVLGPGRGHVELAFHLPPGEATLHGTTLRRPRHDGRTSRLEVAALVGDVVGDRMGDRMGDGVVVAGLEEGGAGLDGGWIAEGYGRRVPAPVARFRTEHRFPVRLVSVIGVEPTDTDPTLPWLVPADGGLMVRHGGGSITIEGERVRATGTVGSWEARLVASELEGSGGSTSAP